MLKEVEFYQDRWVEADDKAGKLMAAMERKGDYPQTVLGFADVADLDWESDVAMS